MDWRNLHGVIDVSPFMLFESTGDSEEDSDQAMSSFDDDTMDVSYEEVDDAQSCCSDSSEICGDYDVRDHFRSNYSRYSKNNSQEYVQHQDENDHYDNDEDEEDDGVIDQVCSRRKLGFVFSTKQKKSKVYDDSTIEPLKKEENDKLFWDTCLAS